MCARKQRPNWSARDGAKVIARDREEKKGTDLSLLRFDCFITPSSLIFERYGGELKWPEDRDLN